MTKTGFSGSVWLEKLRTTWPWRSIRYLWKFQPGASPVRVASWRYSGWACGPSTAVLLNMGNFTPKVFSQKGTSLGNSEGHLNVMSIVSALDRCPHHPALPDRVTGLGIHRGIHRHLPHQLVALVKSQDRLYCVREMFANRKIGGHGVYG